MSDLTVSLEWALTWTQRLCALSLVLQSVELLLARQSWFDDGVFSWQILRAEHERLPAPLAWLFAPVMPSVAFGVLLLLRIPLACLLGAGAGYAAPLLLFSQLAIGARFRGTYNGGSDYMSVVVLCALSAAWLSAGSPTLVKASLAYACVQLVLSYFIAGVVKLVRAPWRSGAALSTLVQPEHYGTPRWVARALHAPAASRPLSWLLLAFECGFPLALTGPTLALGAMTLGLAFHIANFVVFGLNRFVFAWLAAYPSLLFFSAALARSRA